MSSGLQSNDKDTTPQLSSHKDYNSECLILNKKRRSRSTRRERKKEILRKIRESEKKYDIHGRRGNIICTAGREDHRHNT